MDYKIQEVGQRIKGLREILDISKEEMAKVTGVSQELYDQCEAGLHDFSFTFFVQMCREVWRGYH